MNKFPIVKSRGNRVLDTLRTIGKKAQKALKATGKTTTLPFYSSTEVAPRHARPQSPLDVLVQPDLSATNPSTLGRKHEKNIASLGIVDEKKTAEHSSGRIQAGLPSDLLTPLGMRSYVIRQWQEVETGGRFSTRDIDGLMQALEQLVSAQMGAGIEPAHARENAIIVSNALAGATDGDPARAAAALGALGRSADASMPAQSDMLRFQIALGKTGTGMQTLLQIAPHVFEPYAIADASGSEEVPRDAFRHALRAADQLLSRQPLPGLVRLDQLADLADAGLPPAQRTRVNATEGQVPSADGWTLAPDDMLAAKALCAALILKANPHARLPPHLAEAYMAWRNGFDREGPGTDLEKTRQRMFKLFKYVERAASKGKIAGILSGFVGKSKSPLTALDAFGARGIVLGHPDEEFAPFTAALSSVKEQLRHVLINEHLSQRERALCAVRLATLEHWEGRMATSGLRETTRFDRGDHKAIAIRARALLPNRIQTRGESGVAVTDADHLVHRDENVVLLHNHLDKLKKITPAVLQNWAREAWAVSDSSLPPGVESQIMNLRQAFDKDVRPRGADANAQFAAIDDLIRTMPETYDIRLTGGGTYGVSSVPSESLAALAGKLAVPAVAVLPDVGYIKGRHAVIDVGSNAHFGHLFIGADARSAMYAGGGGFAGWAFGGAKHNVMMAAVSGGVRRGRTSAGPQGVTIRVRRSGGDGHESLATWRTKLLDVVETARTSGPSGGVPRNVDELWSGLAHKFAADPAVSINWTESHSTTRYTTGSASATLRAGTPNTRVGPSFSASVTRSTTRNRLDDKTGSLVLNTAVRNQALSVPLSATLIENVPSALLPGGGLPAHERGHIAALSFPSVAYAGIGTTLWATNTNAALRVGRDGDRVAANLTFKDTEFGTYQEFKQYVDHCRPRLASAFGGTEEAHRKLDEMLTLSERANNGGNVIMGERCTLTDAAGKRLNFLYQMRRHHEGASASSERKTEIGKIDAEIAQTFGADASWNRPTLYVLETLGKQRTAGLSFMVNMQSTQSVSGVRELSVLAPPRP
ncbi:hypothetical protein [Burkholderia cepacia]|uniref:hypothetical protein n=1 Tax=Burkholderia cepacia TaxID=292 RepID=UPI00114653AB|nr:hypothetical protein [Burkholderia cepacia]